MASAGQVPARPRSAYLDVAGAIDRAQVLALLPFVIVLVAR